MKKNLLFFVIWFFSIISGQESNDFKIDTDFFKEYKSKDFDFDQEKQTCKVFNNEFPLGMCKDLIDFSKKAKEQLVDNSKKQDQLVPKAIFLNGEKNLKNNAAFLLSEISGIEYRQINFKNIQSFKNKSEFKTYLEKLWIDKGIDDLIFSQKTILALNNLNYLNEEFSQAVIELFEEKIKKPNSKIASNLLLFGTSFKDAQITASLSKLFENSYTLKNSQKYIINNNKIIFDDSKCIIDDIAYPNKICTEALAFLAAINEFKKDEPHLSKNGEIINSNLNNKINAGASRILLYGKPGNGKTTIGEVFAKIFNAKLIFLDSASVFAKHYGDTEATIQEHFNQAKESIMKGIKVVLLIDEIDAIAYDQDKVNSEGSPKVAAKLQTCIDEINKLPNANLLIIIATTNRKNALSKPIESRFSSKVEIVKPEDLGIANKIANFFEKQDIEVDKKVLLNAVKLSKNFRDCVLCAERISKIGLLCTVDDPKKLAEDYKNCISSLQATYRERSSELLNQTSDNCNKINPILLSISHILGFFRGKKSEISTAENNIDNSSNESENN